MKRFFSTLTAAALVAGAFSIAPVRAQEAPEPPPVPEEALIEDPVGDANFINDGTPQGIHSALPGPGNNHVTGQDASGAADLMKVWMSATKSDISVHFLTEAAPPIGNAVGYSLFIAPGEGEAGSNTVGCLRLVALIPGTNPGGGSYQGPPWVKAHDRCNIGGSVFDAQDGEFSIAAAGDNGITTLTFPREYSPLFADGTVLSAPYAQAHSPVVGVDGAGFAAPSTDNSDIGLDYTVDAGKVKKPKQDKPKKPNKPKKAKKLTKKACKKLNAKGEKKCLKKLKKLKKKNKAKSKKCKAYVPGEQGADLETAVVTDKATEKAPIELTHATEAGFGVGGDPLGIPTSAMISHVFQNIQVDSKSKDTGLWVRVEFSEGTDYDIYLNNPDGTEAAHAAGFNPVTDVGGDGTGTGGHSELTAEQLDGIKTADCQGYTLDIANATGPGEEVTLKLWLGEANYDPAAPPE